MIPVLFNPYATSFNSLGYGALTGTLGCEVRQELSSTGVYELSLDIMATDPLVKFMDIEWIIAVKPNMTDEIQAFVIEQMTKPIDNIISVYATHIAQHRTRLIPVSPINATDLQDALTKIASNSLETNPFSLTSARTSNVGYKTETPRSFRSILGGEEGSLLDVYGGEYIFDNFNIQLVTKRGKGAVVVFEGSQGILLDERYGWFPHVTYGDMTPRNALDIIGDAPRKVIGVTRSYQTRHGAGPFPSEGTFDIDETDNGYGEWAGHFRTGLLDVPTLARARCEIEADEIAVSHMDRYPRAFIYDWKDRTPMRGSSQPVPSGPLLRDRRSNDEFLREIELRSITPVTVTGYGPTTEEWKDRH